MKERENKVVRKREWHGCLACELEVWAGALQRTVGFDEVGLAE